MYLLKNLLAKKNKNKKPACLTKKLTMYVFLHQLMWPITFTIVKVEWAIIY